MIACGPISLTIAVGYDPAGTSTDTGTPSVVGNVAAQAVLTFRHGDGSNQPANLHPGPYTDHTGYAPANDPDNINDADQWQPLRVSDGHGGFVVQKCIAPHWGLVAPFALTSASQFRPTDPRRSHPPGRYPQQAQQEVLGYSAELTDERKVIAEYWTVLCRSRRPDTGPFLPSSSPLGTTTTTTPRSRCSSP